MSSHLPKTRQDRDHQSFDLNSESKTARRTIPDFSATGEPLPASEKAQNPLITNVVAANAGDEYSHTFQDGVKKFTIKSRKVSKIKYSWIAGESATSYMTVPQGGVVSGDGHWLEGKTIYFNTTSNNNTLEIEEWT